MKLIILAGENVFDIAQRLTQGTEDALQAIATVAAIALVVATYFKTRAMVPTLVAIATAAVVLWGVNNAPFLQESTKETIQEGAADPIVAPAQLPA